MFLEIFVPKQLLQTLALGFLGRYLLQLELLSGKAAFVGVFGKFLDGKEILCEGAAPAWCAVSELLPAPTVPEPQLPPLFVGLCGHCRELGCSGAAPQQVPPQSTVKK